MSQIPSAGRRLAILVLLAGCGGEPAEPPSSPAEPPAALAEVPVGTEGDDWTIGPTSLPRETEAIATLAGVREAMHLEGGYDRVVFDLPDGLPDVSIEYVDTPVVTCGSGDEIRPEGDGYLQIRLSGARAHTEDGQPTARHDRQSHGLPALRESIPTCDFEGEVTWVLGLASPEPYRVTRLSAPDRLALDVRHPSE